MYRLVLPIVLTMSLCTVALTDDIPPGHWAHDAVRSLIEAGVLRGYPDGSFRGNAPLSRYAFALALRSALEELSHQIDQLAAEVRRSVVPAPPEPIAPAPTGPSQAERDKLRQIPGDTAQRLQKLEEQLQIVNRLLDEFGKDLQLLVKERRSVAYNIPNMERQIRSLEQLMHQRVRVSGTVDLIGRGAFGVGDKKAVDLNGYLVGGGLLNRAQVTHELNLQVDARPAPQVSAEATLVVGNYLSFLRSASQFAVASERTPGATDFLLWKANAQVPLAVFGRQGTFSVGRFENRITPLTLWRPDVDWYTLLARYDSGYYSMDGVKFQLDTDLASIMLYAARHNTLNSNIYADVMQVSAGNDSVNLFRPGDPLRQRPNRIPYGIVQARHSAGAAGALKLGHMASVGAQFVVLDAGNDLPTSFGTVNQVNVWGWYADITPSERWGLALTYAQSDLLHHGDNRLSRDNWAFLAKAQYSAGDKASFWLGYRDFRPYFAPPGYWGRIGYWHNPTDLKGLDAGLRVRLGSVRLDVRTGFYAGTGKAPPPAGFGTGDKVCHLVLNSQWHARSGWRLSLTYEGVFWDLKDPQRFNTSLGLSAPGKPQEHYLTLGMRYDISRNTTLRTLYQLIAYDANGVASYSLLGSGKEQGGVAVVQLSTAF